VPFSQRYAQITNLQKDVYFVAVLCTALATILFIAPTALHRIEWRERDKEWLLSASNRLAIGGMILLALAMIAAIFLITDVLFSGWVVAVTTAVIAALFAVFWFALPLYRRMSNSS
jgi:Flp pilus assembly protein TadB